MPLVQSKVEAAHKIKLGLYDDAASEALHSEWVSHISQLGLCCVALMLDLFFVGTLYTKTVLFDKYDVRYGGKINNRSVF